ncbi:hypothetical protein AWB69_00906 [Caballeronia udeis]|uniref:Uncharacterized protein n=1 Tax=Caballeronia udeis TaxID=1232866 RepID=A0A158FCP5_9BURK|nr:hypothetical protein [Caballeronia udeis]SAL17079.1 hypothetical protein AWB69_00906 [Caballeronia udeis]
MITFSKLLNALFGARSPSRRTMPGASSHAQIFDMWVVLGGHAWEPEHGEAAYVPAKRHTI